MDATREYVPYYILAIKISYSKKQPGSHLSQANEIECNKNDKLYNKNAKVLSSGGSCS